MNTHNESEMEGSLLLTGPLMSPIGDTSDYWLVSIGKRVYAIAPLLAMAFSTMTQLFNVAKSLAAQSSTANYYNREVEVISNGHTSQFQCEYGDAQTVVVYCPYVSVAGFQAMLVLWCAYFAVFILHRVWASIRYGTRDLRFYIAIDHCDGTALNFMLVALGALLTFVSVSVSVYYMTPQTQWNPNVDSVSLTNTLLFLGVNVASLSRLVKLSLPHNLEARLEDLDCFPEPIFLTHGNSLQGLLRSPKGVLKTLLVASLLAREEGDEEKVLGEYGDPAQIKEAIQKLYLGR